MTGYPKCFNSEKQFKDWVTVAKKSGLSNPVLSFCVDCSFSYKRAMLAEGRCERPNSRFETVINEDEEVEVVGLDG